MRIWLSVMAASFLLPLLYQPLARADSISIELDDTAVRGSVEYWTAERYKTAQPLPLPESEDSLEAIEQKQEAIDSTSEDATPPVSEQGQGPTLRVRPDWQNRLFEEDRLTPEITKEDEGFIPDNTPRPSNVGTQGAYFSSSRLIPVSADRVYPYRTVGKLFFTTPEGEFVCSGSVISRRLVLTAGHCVHSGSGGTAGFFQNFRFAPAYRHGAAPYQTWIGTWVITTRTWATGRGTVPNAADYALIEMRDRGGRKIGQVTGFLGFRTRSLIPNGSIRQFLRFP